jgi:hypothetical protein
MKLFNQIKTKKVKFYHNSWKAEFLQQVSIAAGGYQTREGYQFIDARHQFIEVRCQLYKGWQVKAYNPSICLVLTSSPGIYNFQVSKGNISPGLDAIGLSRARLAGARYCQALSLNVSWGYIKFKNKSSTLKNKIK